MSDLISRSALKKEIESIYLNVSGVRSGKGILAKCMDLYKKAVLEIINNQPTAFDKEKVVAELEEKANFFGTPSMGSLQKFGYCMGIEDAIDIVKRGGIE